MGPEDCGCRRNPATPHIVAETVADQVSAFQNQHLAGVLTNDTVLSLIHGGSLLYRRRG
jgi:hypothetical protein